MMITTNRRGDALLDFLPGDRLHIPEADRHIPLAFTLVVVKHLDWFLLVFNRWRQKWEIPGGGIEPGESPEAGARRELFEETGQTAKSLEYIGLFKYQPYPDNHLELGALYRAELASIQPFVPNNEIERILWWDLRAEVDGYIDPIDNKLIELGAQ